LPELAAENKVQVFQPSLAVSGVTNFVCQSYQTAIDKVINGVRGLQQENEPRKVAIYHPLVQSPLKCANEKD
jgi:hypothetical protein